MLLIYLLWGLSTPIVLVLGVLLGLGISGGSVKMPHPILDRQHRKKVIASNQTTKEPNRCQCGHMRALHKGLGECSAYLYNSKGERESLLCQCPNYISSMAGEVVIDTFEAVPYAVDYKRAIESGQD